jgi:hypothetical protein
MLLHSNPATTTATTANRINTNPKTELATTFDSTQKPVNYSINSQNNEINYCKMRLDEHNVTNYYPHHHNHHQTPISTYQNHPIFTSHVQQPPKQAVEDIKIELEDDLLWSSFAEFTNEMILTKAGR